MAKGTVHYDLTANEAPAVDAFRKLTKEQQKAALAFSKTSQAAGEMEQRATRAGRNSKNAFDPFEKTIGNLTRSITGLISGAFSIGAATSAFYKFAEAADKSNNSLVNLTRASLALRSIVPAAKGDIITREVAKQGVKYGIMPAESISAFQRMYAMLGDMDKAKRAAQESYQLQLLGATEEGAGQVIQFGADKGLTPEQSSTMAQIASNRSVYTLNEIAPSMTAIQGFDTAQLGAGAIAAMSKSFKATELGTFARAAGRALNDTQGDFFKRMSRDAGMFGINFASLSNEDRLKYLNQRLGDSVSDNQLRELGLREVEQSRGLGSLIRNAPLAFDIAQQIKTIDTGEEDRALREMISESPDVRRTFSQSILAAEAEYARAYGPQAQQFATYNQYRTEQGAAWRDSAMGPYVTDDAGRLSGPGMFIERMYKSMELLGSATGPGGPMVQPVAKQQLDKLSSIDDSLKRLTDTLAPTPQKVQVRAD